MLEIPWSISGADCYQERGAICQNHVMDQKPNFIRTDLHSSVLEVLGHYEEFNGTSRTQILTFKLQKGPFERCVFCLFFFLFFLSSGTDFKMPNFIFLKNFMTFGFFFFFFFTKTLLLENIIFFSIEMKCE